MNLNYVPAHETDIYKLYKTISNQSWIVYNSLSWNDKQIMGNQFIRAIDSIGANFIEGYNRYHFADKLRFYYYARASLAEGIIHWLEVLNNRQKVKNLNYNDLKFNGEKLHVMLNNIITTTKKLMNKEK